MPVIGRLDDQVGRVLITPLERGREDEEAPAAADEPGITPPPEEPDAAPRDVETSAPPVELPIWLL